MKRLLVLLTIPLAVACGSEPSSPGSPRPPSSADYDGAWGLQSGHGPDGDIAVIEGAPITLDIDGGSASGRAACNYYGGDVTTDGSSFHLQGGSMTEMACEEAIMEAEARYMAALMVADTISREEDTLSLTGPDAELVFEFLAPPPTASLTDTTWHLESLVHGRGPDGFVSSTYPAELILHGDGKLEGSTGCRRLTGEWIEGGHTIDFTTFGAEGNCPPDLREQDDHVVGVLGDGFTAEIEGNELTIYAARGTDGLTYSSDP